MVNYKENRHLVIELKSLIADTIPINEYVTRMTHRNCQLTEFYKENFFKQKSIIS